MQPQQRLIEIDTIKVVLMFLVVFGHIIEPAAMNTSSVRALYCAIYAFHIPAFVFFAGLTSHRVLTWWHIAGMLLALTVFQFLYVMQFAGENYPYFVQPYWLLWYLLSLFFWRLCLPLFYSLRFPLTAALFLALLSGILPLIGYEFSAARTLTFLPFFVLGHFHGRHILSMIQSRNLPSKLFITICATTCIFAISQTITDPRWFHGSYTYAALGASNFQALFYRLAHYIAAIAGIILLLTLVPQKHYRLTPLGGRTMSIYVLHGFFVAPLSAIAIALLSKGLLTMLVFSILCAVWLIFVLSSDFLNSMVQTLYRPEQLYQKIRKRLSNSS